MWQAMQGVAAAHPWAGLAVAAVVMLALVGGTLGVWHWRHPMTPAERAELDREAQFW